MNWSDIFETLLLSRQLCKTELLALLSITCVLNFSTKSCKYFDMGKGTCPFGNSCFYKHGMFYSRSHGSVPEIFDE